MPYSATFSVQDIEENNFHQGNQELLKALKKRDEEYGEEIMMGYVYSLPQEKGDCEWFCRSRIEIDIDLDGFDDIVDERYYNGSSGLAMFLCQFDDYCSTDSDDED